MSTIENVKVELTNGDVSHAIDQWKVEYDSEQDRHLKKLNITMERNPSSVMVIQRFYEYKASDIKKLTSYILTSSEDRSMFLNKIKDYNKKDASHFDRMVNDLKDIRSRKQRNNKVTIEELQYAIETEDIEGLRSIFMNAVFPYLSVESNL